MTQAGMDAIAAAENQWHQWWTQTQIRQRALERLAVQYPHQFAQILAEIRRNGDTP